MSRIPKWKIEKTKAKVVFRLQFHATHIPQPGWDKLFVSFFSLETGKVTAKTTKANVRNGSCNWPDPVYETTRLLHDIRTKMYDEKLYKIVVAMGTSRSSLLGEVNINLAEFVDAFKPLSISLPLEECEFGTILHVTVQLLTSKTGFREFEKQREFGQKGIHMISDNRIKEPAEKVNCSAESGSTQTNKVQKRFKSKQYLREFTSHEELGGSNEYCEDLAVGIDGSSCTSESVYTDKSDNNSTLELGNMNTSISGGCGRFPLGQTAEPVKDEQSDHHLLAEGSNDLNHGWGFGYSVNNDLTIASEENNRLRGSLEVAESAISEFKMEVSSLQTLADELSEETKNIVQQLEGELASGEALAKEVCLLKSEYLKFKGDLEELKHSKDMLRFSDGRSHLSNSHALRPVSENTKLDQFSDASSVLRYAQTPPTAAGFDSKLGDGTDRESQVCHSHDIHVRWLHGLTLMEGKVKEIQNKSELLYHGKDIDILNADFQTLDSVLWSLKGVIIPPLSSEGMEVINTTDILVPPQKFEAITPGYSLGRDSSNSLQQRVSELLNELEISKIEEENLTKKMSQMENYYEALIQELEDGHKSTLNELDVLKSEHSTCFYTISSFQVRIEKMHQDMNGQLSRFADERHSLNSLNRELERRASASEAMLKKIRCNYSIAVDQLQKDLELLSGQVLSLFETNENLAKQAFSEASQLLLRELPYEHLDIGQVALHKSILQATIHEGYLLNNSTGVQPIVDPPVEDGAPLKLGNNILQHCAHNGQSRKILPSHAESQISKDEGGSPVNGFESEKTPLVFRAQESSACIVEAGLNNYAARDTQVLKGDDTTDYWLRSNHLLHDLRLGTEAELYEMHMVNVCLEVFVKILQETLHEKLCDIQGMKKEINELSQQLDNSTKSNDMLMLKLENTMKNAGILRENEAKYVAECDDLTMRNHILEAKLHDVADENSLLSERIAECQRSILECKDFETKYKACDAEKMDLEQLLKKESAQKTSVQGELDSIMEEYKTLKAESTNQCSVIGSLEKALFFVNEKLGDLLFSIASCDNQISESAFASFSLKLELRNKNYMAILTHMEQCLQGAYKKILQLNQEKKAIESERNTVQGALNSTECSLQEILNKLLFTDAVVQKLQVELEEVVEKLKITSEAETMHAEKSRELLQRNMILEVELENLNTENRDLAKSLLRFESINEELERTKLRLADSMQEKEKLLFTLQSGNLVSVQLEDAIRSLEVKLKCADDEIQSGKNIRLKLEDTVSELNLQLNEKCEQLLLFDGQKTEIANLRLQISELESHNSRLRHILLQNEECQRKLNDEASLLQVQVSDLEKTMIFVNEKLQDLCSSMDSIDKNVNSLAPANVSLELELENKNYVFIMMHLKQALERTHEKILGQMQEKEEIKEQGDTAQGLLNDTASSLQDCMARLDSSSARVQELQLQLEDAYEKLKIRSEAENMLINENKELTSKITVLEYELQLASSENRDMAKKLLEFESIKEELEKAKLSTMDCKHEKETLMFSMQSAKEASIQIENELCIIKERLKCSNDELKIERALREKLEHTNSELKSQLNEKSVQLLSFDVEKSETSSLRLQISELELQKSELQNRLLQSDGLQKKLNDENLSLHFQVSKQESEIHILKESSNNVRDELNLESACREDLESRVADLILQVNEKSEQLLYFDEQKTELLHHRQHILDLRSETSRLNQILSHSQECTRKREIEISTYNSQVSCLENELRSIKACLRSVSDELLSERGLKKELDIIVRDLRSQLNDKEEQLLYFSEKTKELDKIRHCVSDLEAENSELQSLIVQGRDSQRKLNGDKNFLHMQVADLEAQISAIQESLLIENVKVIFIGSQFYSKIQIVLDQLNMLEKHHKDLQMKNLNIIGSQQNFMSGKEENIDEHEKFSLISSTSKFEFEAGVEDKKAVEYVDRSSMICAQIENLDSEPAFHGMINSGEQNKEEDETEKLRNIIPSFEDDINSLRSFSDEVDIPGLVLKLKLDEQKVQISLLEAYGVELMKLREQNNELNIRLSEQILKAEEFKNLSIHLNELKDKANAECLQVHEKKETGGPPPTVQESLRMAFIKEQCETEVLELRNQLQMSKMHGDELLLKLQNILDEIEMRKKNEVAHWKRNEELSKKVSELEDELQKVVTSRREFVTTYDEMKAELECSNISLDCCKEEKIKLEGQLRESNEERAKFRVELDLMKRRMEILISAADYLELKNHDPSPVSASFGQLLEEIGSDVLAHSPTTPTTSSVGSIAVKDVDDTKLMKVHYKEHDKTLSNNGSENLLKNSKASLQDCLEDNLDIATKVIKKKSLSMEHIDFEEQTEEREILKSKLELLHYELEKMKNENLAAFLPLDEHHSDPELQSVQKELSQLSMANEHLANLFPSFKGFLGNKNAMERVLALELELAEALQRKKSNTKFQSSFLRQHSDDEAVFQSFRDINELIKDMLEMKGRHAAVEAELKEMHSRYSDLSLQLAEVEGERQKLIMTLKNRTPRRCKPLSTTSSPQNSPSENR